LGARLGGPVLPRVNYEGVNAPESFDARENWPDCPTMKAVRDQSNCGSCWAFGAVESMSDRLCSTFGTAAYRNLPLSSVDMLGCCTTCGMGCQGGYPSSAWSWYQSHGLTLESCDKYPLAQCEHHIPPNHYPACPSTIAATPTCPQRCDDGSPITQATRYHGASTYSVHGEANMQTELQKNGPFEVAFNVYADFEAYKGGVYQHKSGSMLGGHAVKVVGWGVDNGTPYWTIANSWNADWGEEGFFRIIRGTNECGIESQGVAGMPKQA